MEFVLFQQQQQQGLNLTSGFKTAPAEVGLNLSLQNGINLSRNPDRAQGQGGGAAGGNGSYYYTSNVTSGYINLSTQKYPVQGCWGFVFDMKCFWEPFPLL